MSLINDFLKSAMPGKLIVLILIILFTACREANTSFPKEGQWHGFLDVMDGRQLPFTFGFHKSGDGYRMKVFNAGEVVDIDSIVVRDDSIHIAMPVFEGYIKCVFSEREMRGSFVKESLNRVVPFHASFGEIPRFAPGKPPEVDVSGTWETEFMPEGEEQYPAQGLFVQKGGEVTGTFRTTKGDYRYLQGIVSGDSLKLSTFDGAHAFLFTAKVTDSILAGTFYSGNHSREEFSARRNPDFIMPDETTLTYLKEGSGDFNFSFPDIEGNLISLSDSRFEDKVVIVQIMGTWCPNCLDETRFLAPFFKDKQEAGLEIAALAFEYAKTPEKAFQGIRRLKEREGVPYPILLAQFGSSNKALANEKLPMLNHVLSYPTTILIDRTGVVRRIYTGFNGPATGEVYEEFKIEFEGFVDKLLSE
jgi:thiol-disulfide isomerase/thioredoxin